MIIISPHPTEELRLIKYQKELVRKLFTPGTLIYAHQPLWIPVEFSSVEEAKKSITKVTVLAPEYNYEQEGLICPVMIEVIDGNTLTSKMNFIHGLPRFARNDNNFAHTDGHCEERSNEAIHLPDKIFPLPLKIFRLGECTCPSPNIYELNNVVWKKIK